QDLPRPRVMARLSGATLLTVAGLLGGCQAPPIALPPAVAEPALQARVLPSAVDAAPASPVAAPRSDGPLTLEIEEALNLALENNPRLRQAAARVEAARAGADIAFAPFLPEANSGLRASDFNVPV